MAKQTTLNPPGGKALPPFTGDPTKGWEKNWSDEKKGAANLQSIVNGGNGGKGPSGGPQPGGNGTKNGNGKSTGPKNGNGNGNGSGPSGGGGGSGPLPPPSGDTGPVRTHGPGYTPPGKAGRKVPWGKIGHIAKEAAMYGTGAAYGRYRYREWKEEGALSEGRAQEMAKDVLGREKFIPGIQEDTGVFTLYDVLGVKRNATDQEIKDAFTVRIKLLHPDMIAAERQKAKDANVPFNMDQFKEANEASVLLNEAKSTLLDPAKRRAYNQRLDEEAAARAQRAAGTTIPPEHSWEQLPGSYKKRFRGQAREQLRKEKEIYSEARRLGIPTTQPGFTKSWISMSPAEKERVQQVQGIVPPTDTFGRQKPITVEAGQKTVSQLEREVEAQKGTVAKLQAEKGLQEMAAREASPDKRKKAMGYAGQAAGVIGKAGKSAGATGIGQRARSVSGASGALTAVQVGGTSALRGPVAMGGGSLRSAVAGGGPQRVVPGSQTVAGLMTAAPQQLKAVSAVPSGGADLKAAVGGSDRLTQSIRTKTSQPRLPRAGVGPLRQQPPFTGRPVAGLPGKGPRVKQVTGSKPRKKITGRI